MAHTCWNRGIRCILDPLGCSNIHTSPIQLHNRHDKLTGCPSSRKWNFHFHRGGSSSVHLCANTSLIAKSPGSFKRHNMLCSVLCACSINKLSFRHSGKWFADWRHEYQSSRLATKYFIDRQPSKTGVDEFESQWGQTCLSILHWDSYRVPSNTNPLGVVKSKTFGLSFSSNATPRRPSLPRLGPTEGERCGSVRRRSNGSDMDIYIYIYMYIQKTYIYMYIYIFTYYIYIFSSNQGSDRRAVLTAARPLNNSKKSRAWVEAADCVR